MNYIKSIYAGLVIGLGGFVYLNCDDKVIGSFLFSIGLIAVLTFGFNLYTGKVCSMEYLAKPKRLVPVWIGNLIGTLFMSMYTIGHAKTIDTAKTIVENKLLKNPGVTLLDSIVCGFCIAIAVKGYVRVRNAGRYLIVILGVMVFILAGAEHCIADMFYIFCARMISLRSIVFILFVTLGNSIGGIIFCWL